MLRIFGWRSCIAALASFWCLPAIAQNIDKPAADQSAEMECASLCKRILDASMTDGDQQKLRMCVVKFSGCIGGKGGALAGRDPSRDVMNGYQRPEAMFDLPRAYQRGLGRVDG